MKFRFCGDLDCPDWVLAEIHTLSKMSCVKLRLLCQQVATSLCGNSLDNVPAIKRQRQFAEGKKSQKAGRDAFEVDVALNMVCWPDNASLPNAFHYTCVDKVRKLISDSNLEENAMEACVSALNMILSSSAKYGVERDVLGYELEQLGLPKEHANALCKVYAEYETAISKCLASKVLRINEVESFRCILTDSTSPNGLMKMEIGLKEGEKLDIYANRNQLLELYSNLKEAQTIMKAIPEF